MGAIRFAGHLTGQTLQTVLTGILVADMNAQALRTCPLPDLRMDAAFDRMPAAVAGSGSAGFIHHKHPLARTLSNPSENALESTVERAVHHRAVVHGSLAMIG